MIISKLAAAIKKNVLMRGFSFAVALLLVGTVLYTPTAYSDEGRKEFSNEISKEKTSEKYDGLAEKAEKAGKQESFNVASGEASTSGSVAERSVSASSANGSVSGSASGSVLSGSAKGNYSADLTENGAKVSVGGKAEGALAEGAITGEAGTNLGGVGVSTGGAVTGKIGAEAEATANATLTTNQAMLEGKAGFSAGAKVEGDVHGSVDFLGVAVTGKVEGDFRAGASAEAHGIISLGTRKIIIGGKLAGAIGIGGGIGTTVTIDASKLVDDIKSWFNSSSASKPSPTLSPPPPVGKGGGTPILDNATPNFDHFDAMRQGGLGSLGGTTPTGTIDGVSSRDMGTDTGTIGTGHDSQSNC